MAGALIGALRVSLSAETSAFEAGMKRSQKTAATTASKIKSSFGSIAGEFSLLKTGIAGFLGALSIGTLIAAGKAALDYAGSLGETAQQLGVTTKELQTFRYAAQQNGVSLEEADKGLQKLTLSLSKASAGSKPTIAAFKSVGVSLDDIKNKGAVEIFGQMADGMNKTGGASKNAAAGAAIMGKSFQKFVPLADQGSKGLNELARAAEELGVVLSDEQIAKADETADKLDALQTVLKAQIAGVVADNADSILSLANAIAEVAREAAHAIGFLRNFYDEAQKAALKAENFLSRAADVGALGPAVALLGRDTRAQNRASNDAQIAAINNKQGEARFSALFKGRPKRSGGGGNIDQFLAGGGGGSKHKTRQDHTAERALREANQFDQDIRRAKIDVLNATKDLATDAIERYNISIQIKDAEDAAFDAELEYQQNLYKLTKGQDGLSATQAQELKTQHDIVSSLERKKLIADEQHRAFEESAHLDDLQFDLERARLQSEEQLAETAKEQRDVRLRLLDLDYRQERARLQTILADEQASETAKEEARRRLANLNRTFGNDRQSVVNNTRGPMEQFHAQFSDISEEMEQIKVDGINAAASVLAAFNGDFGDLRDNAISALQQIASELIRVQLLKAATSIFGGGEGATGVAGGAAQGAQLAASATALTTAGGTLTAAGGTLTGAGAALTTSGTTLVASAAPLTGAGLGLTTASLSLNTAAILWTATAAEITAAASLLLAANAAGSVGAGFASGGFTGNGGLNDIAGFVHGKEFVVNAKATRQFMPLLAAINSGKLSGMAKGGLVGVSMPRSQFGSRVSVGNDNGPRGGTTIHAPITIQGNASRQTALQLEGAVRRGVGRAARVYGN